MATSPVTSPGRSHPGTWFRRGAAWILLPGLALGIALGCGPGTNAANAPTITSFTPASGNLTTGTTVTVYGSGFSVGVSSGTLGGVAIYGTVLTDGQLTFPVPANAVTGTIDVTTSGGTATSGTEFLVTPWVQNPPAAPASGQVGTPVTITGQGLSGIGPITISYLSGTPITITQTNLPDANQIQFTIPSGSPVDSSGTDAHPDTITIANSVGLPDLVFPFDVTP